MEEFPSPSRRSFLRQVLLGMGTFTLPNICRLRAEAGTTPARNDTSLILLWQDGGPSQFETFDPKPEAPLEIRGELGAIATRLSGVRYCEVLPRLAQLADRCSVIRSLHQASSDHVSAAHTFITGYDRTGVIFGPPDHPDLGSVIHRMRRGHPTPLPNYVALGAPSIPRGGSAYLGPSDRAFTVLADPSQAGFRVENLQRPEAISTRRFSDRMDLLARFDSVRREVDASGHMQALDRYQQRAWGLLTSPQASRAFDLEREDPRLRDRYGRHKAGQQALLARRLVEAGVSVVAVRFHPPGPWHDSWDDHPCGTHVFGTMKGRGPFFDQAVSALIEDLGSRGLDRNVLVVVAGEFGRTPRVRYYQGVPGRDHWGAAGCALVYGGGLRMGQVIGATNRRGEHPVERPVRPQDLLATIYRFLGIDPRHEFANFAGRPIPILPYGEPIRELVG